jgi:hypothetical protein
MEQDAPVPTNVRQLALFHNAAINPTDIPQASIIHVALVSRPEITILVQSEKN